MPAHLGLWSYSAPSENERQWDIHRKGTLKIIHFQPSCMGRDTFHQTMLPRPPSNLTLNTRHPQLSGQTVPVPPWHLWALNCQASLRWCRMTCSWLTAACPAPTWMTFSIRVLAHCSLKSVPQLTAWSSGMSKNHIRKRGKPRTVKLNFWGLRKVLRPYFYRFGIFKSWTAQKLKHHICSFKLLSCVL